MPIATGLALGLAGIGAAGSIGGAALGAHAAGQAANTQAAAAAQGANLQYQLGQENLGLQQDIFNTEQANQRPFLEAGQNAVQSINRLLGQGPLNAAPAASTAPINVPQMPNPYAPAPPPMPTRPNPNNFIPRATGGPLIPPNEMNRLAPRRGPVVQKYLVGERGPEEIDMYPSGGGMVKPIPTSNRLIHRAAGGPLGFDHPIWNGSKFVMPGENQGVAGQGGTGGQVPISQPGSPVRHGSPGVPQAPANLPQPNPYQADPNAKADQNNVLVTGGSATPSQNVPFSSFTQQFTAPTIQQAEQYPGYQFQLQQGENALLNNASALGTTSSPATGAALAQYAQGLAQSDYGNVYNQAMQQYLNNYNIFSNNQANQFNRLASTAGLGQVANSQLGSAGNAFGTNAGNTLLNTGQGISQALNNAGAARASGYIGAANAYGGAINGLTSMASLPLYLQLLQQQS